ncbi:hypothetical protein PZA11_006752 [Diplocarpon coronariae]
MLSSQLAESRRSINHPRNQARGVCTTTQNALLIPKKKEKKKKKNEERRGANPGPEALDIPSSHPILRDLHRPKTSPTKERNHQSIQEIPTHHEDRILHKKQRRN